MSIKVYSRRQLMAFKPYDAEIEYLESTGTQYIDLGFTPTNEIQFSIDINRRSNSIRWDCGSEETWTKNAIRLVIIEDDSAFWRYGGNRVLTNGPIIASSNLIGDLILTANKQRVVIQNITTGNSYAQNQSYSSFSAPDLFYLFSFSINDPESSQLSPTSAGVRFKSGEIVDTGVHLNLISVRIGNTGYLYDKVSGKLFGNAGTGNFILGPDK